MLGNIIGFIISILLIGVGFLLHNLVKKKDRELARKILHIWVGNWFFIYKYLFTSSDLALLGLLGFAGLNFYYEQNRYHTGRYGTVYFPLAISLLLMLIDLEFGDVTALGCAILVLAYGDGLAAIVGGKIKSKTMPFQNSKTVVGSLTMFVISTIVLILFKCPILYSFAIGLVAALVEAYSPLGLDNISVPVVVFGMYTILCLPE